MVDVNNPDGLPMIRPVFLKEADTLEEELTVHVLYGAAESVMDIKPLMRPKTYVACGRSTPSLRKPGLSYLLVDLLLQECIRLSGIKTCLFSERIMVKRY